MTTDLLDSGTRAHVDIGRIERLLGELWRQTAEERERGLTIGRVRVLNLIVYTEDPRTLEQVQRLAEVLPARHPCRMVVIHGVPDEPGEEMDAAISARCAVGAGGRRQVCCEVIALTAPGATRGFVSSAVASLVVAGLPVVVWWTGAPRPQDEVFQELTAELADQVIVDSRAGGDDAAAVTALARWLQEAHRHAVPTDLAWARILPWRQVVAEFFDPPAARALLAELREVELTCVGELLSADALLLAGWLASRLRWRLLDVSREGAGVRAIYRSPGRLVDLRLRQVAGSPAAVGPTTDGIADPEGRMVAVRLLAGPDEDLSAFRAYRDQDADVVHTQVHAPGRPDFERAAALLERSDDALLSDLLDPRGRDAVYEAALTRAAELAGAVM